MISETEACQFAAETIAAAPISSKRTLTRRFNSKPNMLILPGIRSSDVSYRLFMKELYEQIERISPAQILDNGAFNLLPRANNASILRTMPGSVRLPLDYSRPAPSETMIDTKVMNIIDIVMRLVNDSFVSKPGIITKDSSSGYPYFVSSLKDKIEHAAFIVSNIRRFNDLWLKGHKRRLLHELGVGALCATQIRLQNDIWVDGRPKERRVVGFNEAYCGFSDTYQPNPMFDDWFATCRTRVVKAMPSSINNIFSSLFEGFKAGFFSKYENTFKHRGSNDVLRKIKRFNNYIGVDISAYDRNMPKDIMFECVRRFKIKDDAKEIIIDYLLAPQYATGHERYPKQQQTESLFSKRYSTWKGMPSGVFFTTLMNNIVVLICKLHEYATLLGRDFTQQEIVDILNHEHNTIGFLIMGDDGIDCINDTTIVNKIKDKGFNNKYLTFSIDNGISFLGDLVYIDSAGETQVCKDIVKYLSNLYIPEQAAYSNFRKLPINGMVLRRDVFCSNPLYSNVREIEKSLFRKHFRVDMDHYEVEHMRQEEKIKAELGINLSFTPAQAELLDDPSKLHYKYSESDFDPEFLDTLVGRMPDDLHNTIIEFYKE